MGMQFSVIVPVYNAEHVIKRCVDSILNQTIDDFELILIDDGSTDTSGSICDLYEQRDHRVHVIHQVNKGVSAARNAGIQAAKGQYLVFVDSDDFVDPYYLKNVNENDEMDWVITGFYFVDETGNITGEKRFEEKSISYPLEDKELMAQLFIASYFTNPVAKRYSAKIIKQNDIIFDEHLDLGEDTDFNLQYLYHCRNISTKMDTSYRYVSYEKMTLSNQKLTKEKIGRVIKGYQKIESALYKIIGEDAIQIVRGIMARFYRDYVAGMFGDNHFYSFDEIYSMWKGYAFETLIKNSDELFSNEGIMLRKVIGFDSPILFFLYMSFHKIVKLSRMR